MHVLPLYSIRDTQLWQRLNSFSDTDKDLADNLAQRLITICEDAEDRMKGFAAQHPQYTLHDRTHLLRVTELMWRVMPQGVAEKLNPVEITLLILAAYFHDQGMVLDADERAQLEANSEFRLHQQNWEIEHPNLRDVKQRLRDQSLSEAEVDEFTANKSELEAASLTDYVRKTHGENSARMVREEFVNDRNWVIAGRNVADLVAHLCLSHVLPASSLIANPYRVDEMVGFYRVNLRYLAVVLRLADILDFDADRAPHPLSRTIDFRSKVSEAEWAKHLAVKGEEIESGLVRFTMECEKPEYQRAALEFMDWIDAELATAQEIINRVPHQVAGYRIDLPVAVDRSRIEPKDGAYIYSDLEFSLSRDEIVKLLMTDQLYGSPSLCIRELVQNAMDALRHRSAIFQRDNDGQEWKAGKVTMTHELDEHGHEVVRCTDNGIGMTRQTIEKFLTRAGRSYYRSPEWEQERQSLRAAGVDFDPCAQFGIGFMSCFMLGDRIKITTRRDNGWGKDAGDPLVVEINGLSSMVVIRDGASNQPAGTTIEITGRKKPRYLHKGNDKVQLIGVIHNLIVNCEFPVEAICNIEGLKTRLITPTSFAKASTILEKMGVEEIVTFEKDFSLLSRHSDESFQGFIKESFLIDEEGKIVLDNSEAKWNTSNLKSDEVDREIEEWFGPIILKRKSSGKSSDAEKSNRVKYQIAIDGVLVVGELPETAVWLSRKGFLSVDEPYGIGGSCFKIDVRGGSKPPLSPARQPLNWQHDVKWNNVMEFIEAGRGKIWDELSMREEVRENPIFFWTLFVYYDSSKWINNTSFRVFPAIWMSCLSVYHNVHLPFDEKTESDSFFLKFDQLRRIHSFVDRGQMANSRFQQRGNRDFFGERRFDIINEEGHSLNVPEQIQPFLTKTEDFHRGRWYEEEFVSHDLFMALSTMHLNKEVIDVRVHYPSDPDSPIYYCILWYNQRVYSIPYVDEAADYLCIHTVCLTANRLHSMTRLALTEQRSFNKTQIGELAGDLVWLLCQPESFYILDQNTKAVPRWCCEIAHRVLEAVDEHPEWPSPPYKVRLENGGTVEVTREMFERWANAEPLDDEDDD